MLQHRAMPQSLRDLPLPTLVALAVAALMILFPPWFEPTDRGGDFIGYRPLFAAPLVRYTVSTGPRITDYAITYKSANVGMGVLITQLLALGIVAATVNEVRRRRGATAR